MGRLQKCSQEQRRSSKAEERRGLSRPSKVDESGAEDAECLAAEGSTDPRTR